MRIFFTGVEEVHVVLHFFGDLTMEVTGPNDPNVNADIPDFEDSVRLKQSIQRQFEEMGASRLYLELSFPSHRCRISCTS